MYAWHGLYVTILFVYVVSDVHKRKNALSGIDARGDVRLNSLCFVICIVQYNQLHAVCIVCVHEMMEKLVWRKSITKTAVIHFQDFPTKFPSSSLISLLISSLDDRIRDQQNVRDYSILFTFTLNDICKFKMSTSEGELFIRPIYKRYDGRY